MKSIVVVITIKIKEKICEICLIKSNESTTYEERIRTKPMNWI